MSDRDLISVLKSCGTDLAITLPCDKARELFFDIPKYFRHVGIVREEDGVGIAAGAYLGGAKPVLVIQSSGIGNMLNALMSLSRLYRFPLPVIASLRGGHDEAIAAQVPFNSRLPSVLKAVQIPYCVINTPKDLWKIRDLIAMSFKKEIPVVGLISPSVFRNAEPVPETARTPACLAGRMDSSQCMDLPAPSMTRYGAIQTIMDTIKDELIVTNIGVPSKEVYAIRDRPKNFYMLGSYTQASSIGLGLSLSTDEKVTVIDGDGSLLGSSVLPVIGEEQPRNLRIICLDNGTFGSTGNQPSPASGRADLATIAYGSGIQSPFTVSEKSKLVELLNSDIPGPLFIRFIINPGNSSVPNIPLSPIEIRERFMGAIRKESDQSK